MPQAVSGVHVRGEHLPPLGFVLAQRGHLGKRCHDRHAGAFAVDGGDVEQVLAVVYIGGVVRELLGIALAIHGCRACASWAYLLSQHLWGRRGQSGCVSLREVFRA